ncbi:MAG: GDSL-type esterase/lipase family protein [Fimbriimonadaceae bacterium]
MKNKIVTRSLVLIAMFVPGTLSFGVNLGRIMCVGDSLTGGAGQTPYNQFREPLNNLLVSNSHTKDFVGPENGFNFESGLPDNQHAGFGGWGIPRLLTGYSDDGNTYLGAGKYSEWLTTYDPDVVVFFAGGNDIWRWYGNAQSNGYLNNAPLRSTVQNWFRDQYQIMLNQTFAFDPSVRLIFGSYAASESNFSVFDRQFKNEVYADIAVIVQSLVLEQQGLGRNIQYAPIFELTYNSATPITYDGTHHNLYGSGVVGNEIYSQLLNPVPEPSSMILAGVGILAFLKGRKQKN